MENEEVRYLSVLAIVGTVCSLPEDGVRVNKIVQFLLNQGCSVRLDFQDVKLVTPSFYAALSKGLYSVFPSSDINKRMAMSNLPDSFPSFPQHRP